MIDTRIMFLKRGMKVTLAYYNFQYLFEIYKLEYDFRNSELLNFRHEIINNNMSMLSLPLSIITGKCEMGMFTIVLSQNCLLVHL